MTNDDKDSEIETIRARVRTIDDEIFGLLIERVSLVRDIGNLKKTKSRPIYDPKREAFNIERNRKLASGKIPDSMINEMTDLLSKWAREIQKTLG
jgi:chorismate mutase/prephenate dehydratase